MVYDAVVVLARVCPRDERVWPGTVTVTRVDGLNGTAGVNVHVSAAPCQLPGTSGVTVGSGDPADSGAEKVTWTGLLPSACRSPADGDTEITRNGPGIVTPLLIGMLGGVPPPCISRNVPAPATSATAAAVITLTLGWRATRPSSRQRNRSPGGHLPAQPSYTHHVAPHPLELHCGRARSVT